MSSSSELLKAQGYGLTKPPEATVLINHYALYWREHGEIPSVAEVARVFNCNPLLISSMLQQDEIRHKIVMRGLPLLKDDLLSADQFKALAVLTDPTITGGLAKRLKVAGISHSVYANWMQQPRFRELQLKFAEQILENNLAGVNLGLVTAAERGDVAAIKFFYELTGRYKSTEGQAGSKLDTMAILRSVLEIIQKHVTDPNTLGLIAQDIKIVADKAGI